MRIRVTVKPSSHTEEVKQQDDGSLLVRVREPAQNGRANLAMLAAVARFYGVPKTSIVIRTGASSRRKILEILQPR